MSDEVPSEVPIWFSQILERQIQTMNEMAANQQASLATLNDRISLMEQEQALPVKALDQLNRTKQGKKNFSDFMNEFNRLLLEAEGWGWDDAVKKGFLKAALTLELRRAMLEQIKEISTFRQGWKKRTDDVRSSATADEMDWQPTTVLVAKIRMKEPRWASEDEIARRREEGLCLRCGRKSHRVKECKADLSKDKKGGKEVRVAPVRAEPPDQKNDSNSSDVEESGKE
ncbi:hypothetical protein EPUS_08403 [Endocarpon pusillum Z07020]|uniref:CCHC-type domain-containing protein n=1 Tax=Endocarpon pusillum (strain Z07020 / HMAS-L-300199) TaxID=1263415 RepID=U1GAL1_ENDPU|nr:uncharacterized protein EPUS_08403 [Endocarpon pusillum Z07020]ERF69053.1 hypothetical protein EPUS_08403 [Endocarpon pusillum Z07020]